MERTEQMYTIQKQMDFGKIKVSVDHVFIPKQEEHCEYRAHKV